MNDSQLYEKIGRLTSALEQIQAEYLSLCRMVVRIKSGEVDVRNVVIDVTGAGAWYIAAPPTVAVVEESEAA